MNMSASAIMSAHLHKKILMLAVDEEQEWPKKYYSAYINGFLKQMLLPVN